MALLGITVLFAASALYVKYRLEALRGSIQARLEVRMGAALAFGAVEVNGLRGLRIDAFTATFESQKGGPTLVVHAPAM
ncbi:MAG TPA: hypothetical protein ENN80_12470, partial [Candidatus Hydrogenedentes bacterium]|nr:hypothetical protein [Candidatus Hydrogenedentota bacterium]